VTILEQRALLEIPAGDAQRSLMRGSSRGNWLLPTLMQMTDPEGRGIEGILASVIDGIVDQGEAEPLLLMLTASLVQASGHSLPQQLGERVVGGSKELTAALATLTAELERQFCVSREAVGVENPPGALITHHRLIAEAFVTIAAESSDHRESFLNACEALPRSVAWDVDEERLIPQPRFRLLDASLRYLLRDDPPRYEGAHRFLCALIDLDDRQFPALTRLGDCDTAWLRAEHGLEHPDPARIDWLIKASRAAYRKARDIAKNVLEDPDNAPAPYRAYDLDAQEELISHSWGVTEDTIGRIAGDRAAFKRAVMLFLEAAGGRGWSTLALPLIHLGELELAARATAVFRDLGTSKRERGFIRAQEKLLRQQGVGIPEGGRVAIDSLIPAIVRELLLDDWEGIALYESAREHREALRRSARRGARLLDRHQEIDELVVKLTDQ
jgi:hypothetical protein